MRGGLILMFMALLLIYGCKNTTTGNVIKDINDNKYLPDENINELKKVLVN